MNAYEQLVAEFGEEGAREIMRARRKLVKKPGFASMRDKEQLKKISRKGADARWHENRLKNSKFGQEEE